MKKILSPTGKTLFYPFKVYCYRPLEDSMRTLIRRSGFEADCERWRSLDKDSDVLGDVYDGQIWKNFDHFFSVPRNYGLMLNADWFQPFKHLSSFSVGAIYLVLLNLPRSLRFKRENVVLVGIIPDMTKEPPTNTFLMPLIEELNIAWQEGFLLKSLISMRKETFHLALLCVGCDIPASRKLGGFLGIFLFKFLLDLISGGPSVCLSLISNLHLIIALIFSDIFQ